MINISSTTAHRPVAGHITYAAAKAGIAARMPTKTPTKTGGMTDMYKPDVRNRILNGNA